MLVLWSKHLCSAFGAFVFKCTIVLFFISLALLKSLRQLFCRISICLQCSNCFLVIGFRVTFWAARLPPQYPCRGVHQELQSVRLCLLPLLQWIRWCSSGIWSIVFQRPSSTRNFQWCFWFLCLFLFFFLTLKLLTSTSLSFHLQQILQFYLNLDESVTKLWKRYIEPGVRFINLPKCRKLPFCYRHTSAKCHLFLFPPLFLPYPLVFLRNM